MLKKLLLLAGLLILAMVLVACGNDGDDGEVGGNDDNGSEASEDEDKADEIYQTNCSSCHGDDLSGDNGPDLQTIGNDMSKDEILEQIEEGGDGMPADIIEGDDADTVASWLAEMK